MEGQNKTTLDYLADKYPVLISQKQLAEIFQRSLSRTRALLRSGDFGFTSISPSQKLYKLSDVAIFIDNDCKPVMDPIVKKRGRPVGSRNMKVG